MKGFARRKRLLVGVLLPIMFAIMLSGCGKTARKTESPAQEVEPKATQTDTRIVKTLSAFTSSEGTTSYRDGIALSKLLKEQLNWTLNVIANPSTPAKVEGLRTHNADLDLENSLLMSQAFSGTGTFEGKPARFLRQLMGGAVVPYGFVTLKKYNIRSVMDLKGKTINSNPSVPIANIALNAILKAYGLEPGKDVKLVPVSSTEVIKDRLLAGQIHATIIAQDAPWVSEVNVEHPVQIVPVDFDKAKKINEMEPGFVPYVLKTGVREYISVDTPVVGFVNVIVTREDLDVETAYKLTKTIIENAPKYEAYSNTLPAYSIFENVFKAPVVPYHDGAIKYLKEAGVWTNEMQAVQDRLLEMAK